jgi:hypothetical protein
LDESSFDSAAGLPRFFIVLLALVIEAAKLTVALRFESVVGAFRFSGAALTLENGFASRMEKVANSKGSNCREPGNIDMTAMNPLNPQLIMGAATPEFIQAVCTKALSLIAPRTLTKLTYFSNAAFPAAFMYV